MKINQYRIFGVLYLLGIIFWFFFGCRSLYRVTTAFGACGEPQRCISDMCIDTILAVKTVFKVAMESVTLLNNKAFRSENDKTQHFVLSQCLYSAGSHDRWGLISKVSAGEELLLKKLVLWEEKDRGKQYVCLML